MAAIDKTHANKLNYMIDFYINLNLKLNKNYGRKN